MRNRQSSFAAVIGCVCAAASAQSVRINTYQGTNSSPTSSTTASSGSNISISIDHQISRICIFTDGGGSSANVGNVSVYHTGGVARSSELQVILMDLPASSGFPGENDNLSPVATNWAGINFDSGTASYATVSGSISGNLTGPISANKIVRIEVGGQASAAIGASTAGTAIGWIELGTSTSAGTISAPAGDIDTILGTSSAGVLSGAISADSGHITLIDASGGISISGSTGIRARDGIDSIQADYNDGTDHWKDVDAVINTSYGASSTDHGLTLLQCGNLAGSVDADNLLLDSSSGIHVHGDLTAPINFGYDVRSDIIIDGDASEPAEIDIGGDLKASVEVNGGDLGKLWVGGSISAATEATIYLNCEYTIYHLNVGGNIAPTEFHQLQINTLRISDLTVGGYMACDMAGPTSLGNAVIQGDMVGNFVIDSFDLLQIGGLLDTLRSGDTMTVSSFPSTALMIVGDSIVSDYVINVLSTIDGQVVVNALDGTGEWGSSGTFTYYNGGAVGFSPIPYYDNTTDVGDGAVGQVPYHLHDDLCEPPNGTDGVCTMPTRDWPVTGGTQTRQTIVLPFYGPVYDHETGDSHEPVKVEWQDMTCSGSCPPSWYCITSECLVLVAPSGHPREVWVCLKPSDDGSTPTVFSQFYNYKVTPRAVGDPLVTDLRCSDTLAAEPPNVQNFTYEFSLYCLERPDRAEGPESSGGGVGTHFYTIDDLDFLLGQDFTGDGIVDDADTAEVLRRLGLGG
jgi:hypothetical protein